jgi:hypothetical protein
MQGKHTAATLIGLLLGLGTLGCIQLTPPLADSMARRRPPREPAEDAAAELRIPREQIVRTDVPLVPLPPVPRGAQPEPRLLPQPAAASPAPFSLNDAQLRPAALNEPAGEAATTPRQLIRQAADSYASIDGYIARLTRREQVSGVNKPEEIMLFKFRKEPWSVYFKWLGEAGKGREVLYVKGRYGDKLNTLLAAGDMPFAPAGKRISLAADSILVRSASRHPIGEAGLGASVARLSAALDAQEKGDRRRGTLTVLGEQQRNDYPRKLQILEQRIPGGAEADLPRGGRRLYGFDPESHLPVLVTTTDDRGQEVEYYRYDRLQAPVRFDDDDFDPEKIWEAR